LGAWGASTATLGSADPFIRGVGLGGCGAGAGAAATRPSFAASLGATLALEGSGGLATFSTGSTTSGAAGCKSAKLSVEPRTADFLSGVSPFLGLPLLLLISVFLLFGEELFAGLPGDVLKDGWKERL